MNNQVDIIIESLWKKYNKKFNTQDYDKESFLKALYNSPPAIIEKNISLLNPWLSILDECLFWLYLHKEFFEKQFQSEKQDELRGVFLLSHKVFVEANSVRLLMLNGYEESSRILWRSCLETSDLILILCTHNTLAIEYEKSSEEGYKGTFWHNHLSNGRASSIINKIIDEVGFEKKFKESLKKQRRQLKSQLSGTVHADHISGFGATLVPILQEPGMLSASLFGRLSAYSPESIYGFCDSIIGYGGLFMKIILNDLYEVPLKISSETKEFILLVERFLAIQELPQMFIKEIGMPRTIDKN